MSISLRPYQVSVDTSLDQAFARYMYVLCVMATGGGKTFLFASRIKKHNAPAAAVVHRKEIIAQISLSLAKLGVKHRVIAPNSVIAMIRRRHLKALQKSYINTASEVGVVSVQTLTSASTKRDQRAQAWISRVSLCVLDECHHYVKDGRWGQTLEIFAHARILGVTATPERADGKGLGVHADGFAQHMVIGPSSFDLIQEGWLSPFKYHAPSTDLVMDDIPITKSGDINTLKMRTRIQESHLVGDIVEHYKRFALGKKTIVFANDVKTAEQHVAEFIAAGFKAVVLSGETDAVVRERELNAFEDGTGAQILVNCELFDEGFDVPAVEAVILARVTFSVGRYLQMIGRCLRPVYADGFDLNDEAQRHAAIAASEKPHAIVIDAVANWERNGMPTWPRAWTLDARDKRTRSTKDEPPPQRICTNIMCNQVYYAYHKACPYCGTVYEYAERDAIDKVDGDLQELDVAAMNALFAKLRRANLSEIEYQAYQIKRGIPHVGRAKDFKRFQEDKHRRKVLEELMAWWIGMQPKRTEAEYQRRFFARFGVDMVTARTLKSKETDQLIDRISRKFTEDL
jgi:DNA repair protein RadD